MTDFRKSTSSTILLPITGEDGWIQIFPAGKTTGHDGRGPYLLENAASVVAASKRPVVDLCIDRCHVMDIAEPGTPAPAAGWIKELKEEAGSIFARVEWTPPAREQLKNKEYRYISPTFLHDAAGRVKRILRASLTNDPNFEMQAVAAADGQLLSTTTENEAMDLKLALIALLALSAAEGEDVSDDAVIEAVTNLKASVDAVKEAVDAPEAAETPEAIVEALDAHVEDEVQKEVASQMKKATASIKRGNPDPSKFVPIESFKELQTQVADLTNESADAKATAAVDAAVNAGKVFPAQRKWAKDYASSNPEGFAEYVKNAPVVLKSTGNGKFSVEVASSNGGLDQVESSIASQLGIKPDVLKAELNRNQQ